MTTKQITWEERSCKVTETNQQKRRVNTTHWNISDNELTHDNQVNLVNQLNQLNQLNQSQRQMQRQNKHVLTTMERHIKSKMQSYKQQDIAKTLFDESQFVTLDHVLQLLVESNLCCEYCSNHVFVLYTNVLDVSQWTLDRIDNHLGHNVDNVLIACLSCNLKRRRQNKDAFLFTKNMVVVKKT